MTIKCAEPAINTFRTEMDRFRAFNHKYFDRANRHGELHSGVPKTSTSGTNLLFLVFVIFATLLPAKLRIKERSRSNTTDINDPENLDYEEEEFNGTYNNNRNHEELNKNSSDVGMDTENLLLTNDEITHEEGEMPYVGEEEKDMDMAKDAMKTKKKVREKTQSTTKKDSKTAKSVDKNSEEKIERDDESGQDEEGELNSNHEASNQDIPTGSDEGEVDEADLEDGEIHETLTKKQSQPHTQHRRHAPPIRPPSIQHSLLHQREQQQSLSNSISHMPLSSQQQKVHCRFFLQGRCHWGANCKYMHPNMNDTKNQSPFEQSIVTSRNTSSPPSSAANVWISPQSAATAIFGNSSIVRNVAAIAAAAAVATQQQASAAAATTSSTESAWERGLRSAKTLREQSMRRKQQDKDFNDKKFNLTLKDANEEKDLDEELVNVERPRADYDDVIYHNNYEERWQMHQHPNSYNYHNHGHIPQRMRHFDPDQMDRGGGPSFMPYNQDRRIRHLDHHVDNKGNRKEKLKDSKTLVKSKDPSKKSHHSSQFPVPLPQRHLQQQHLDDEHQQHQQQQLSSMARRADDWVDPWDRSQNNRRNASRGRENSYTSSSASSSRSSRPRRRSPSVTRSKPARQESVKNGEKHSLTSNVPSTSASLTGENQNTSKKQPTSSTVNSNERHKTATNHHSSSQQLGKKVSPNENRSIKFLPGRTISSHTLKKAEKADRLKTSHHQLNPQTHHQSQKEQSLNKDNNNEKKTIKKDGKRSDSSSSGTSSSSSASSSRVRPKAVSSTSSSRSSSSESDGKSKNRPVKENATNSNKLVNSHTKPTISKQVSSSNRIKTSQKEPTSLSHTKSTTSNRSGTDNKDASNPKSSISHNDKKRRDTSSSSSTTTTKKLKTINHTTGEKKRSSPQPLQTSLSSKKKQKQKILKKLQEVEKLISQRTTKT
ncbi:unnamed protein product [Didymodactylos carnosus]|uniref:C3H1-type domain-containing protein n=1 Tax=Didymodactylos carnosus TaxID=1234261 RepID=A0A813NIL7_9BILA|nr:unnamed protein product [Didymodactylos carnosus]CAF0737034.1 unnamed protein product [Didymodactylos carnosus]CAF3494883.1 unnamed protein product [Didymodactylos carnosus]CAF3515027.1 unnamed protein product [Didymodactylos carnosus]